MNIVLVGMMGSGKTTVGKMLAKKLNYNFFDTDEEIIKLTNQSINQIFEEFGEQTFRTMEHIVLAKILNSKKQIVSTGGGIIKRKENVELIKEEYTVYLKADDNTLFERVKNDSSRPLLNTQNMLHTIQSILYEREPFYEQAKIIIDTVNKTPEEVAQEIIEKIK